MSSETPTDLDHLHAARHYLHLASDHLGALDFERRHDPKVSLAYEFARLAVWELSQPTRDATKELKPGVPETDAEYEPTGLRRGHLADLEVVEAILLSDPRERASGYDADPRAMAEAVRAMIDNPELHNPGSFTGVSVSVPERLGALMNEREGERGEDYATALAAES